VISPAKKYKNIYIVESRSSWLTFSKNYNLNDDLVLTFDFGLKKLIENYGGDVNYIDSLCPADEMQKNNFITAEFLRVWNYNKSGSDIFTFDQVSFGFAFRIEFWSEYLFSIRLRANLEKIKTFDFEKVVSHKNNRMVNIVLNDMGFDYEMVDAKESPCRHNYYFDIHHYMQSQLRGASLKDIARKLFIYLLSNLWLILDYLHKGSAKKIVYIQPYHPTIPIIEKLKTDNRIRVVTSALVPARGWKKFIFQRLVPINSRAIGYKKEANELLIQFRSHRCKKLILADGTDATEAAYQCIEGQIAPRVAEALSMLNDTKRYVKSQAINLEVMITNIGLNQTLMDCFLKSNGIVSFLIINGLLSAKFGDEAKYASFINCYSEETKVNYFKNASNVVCLGDPRMDQYAQQLFQKSDFINRDCPVIGIGSAGFNSTDLISYVAFEFDFIFDILKTLQKFKDIGHKFIIIIKIRPNAVLGQYMNFVNEYFPDLDIQLEQSAPMIDILKKLDLYISFYSQTLIEAACLGIPVIYYKKDNEFHDPPFDGASEIVSTDSINGLMQAYLDFKSSHDRFNTFLNRSVLEKYVGPLDGKSIERNVNFIYHLLDIPENRGLI
jgi:hypothetical protein